MSPAARRFGKDGRRKFPRTCFCIGNSLAHIPARVRSPRTRCRGSASADARCIIRIPTPVEETDDKIPRIGAGAAGLPHLRECTSVSTVRPLPAPAPCGFHRSAFSGGRSPTSSASEQPCRVCRSERAPVSPTCGKLAVFVLRGARTAGVLPLAKPYVCRARHFADRSARCAVSAHLILCHSAPYGAKGRCFCKFSFELRCFNNGIHFRSPGNTIISHRGALGRPVLLSADTFGRRRTSRTD